MKSIKLRIVLFVTAVLLALTAMSSLITAYAVEKEEIDNKGSMVYSQELNLDADTKTCELSINFMAKEEFASYELNVQLPSFVKVSEVVVSSELNKLSNSNFEYSIENRGTLVKTSFVSSQNVSGDYELFVILLDITSTGIGSPYIDGTPMFTNNRYEFFTGVGSALGTINVGGGNLDTTVNKGDANLDGQVTLSDLVKMQRHIVSQNEQLYDSAFTNADINNDGIVNTLDCQFVQMYLVGELNDLNNIGGGTTPPQPDDDKTYFKITIFVMSVDGEKLAEFDTQMYDREFIFEHLYNKTYLGQFDILGAYYDQAFKIPVGEVETIKGPTRLYVVVENFVPQETTILKVYFMLRNEYGKTEQYNYMEMEVAVGSEVGPQVEQYWDSQPYQLEMMSGDMYGNVELPYGRIIWDETEVYLIYNQNKNESEQKEYEVSVVMCKEDGNIIYTECVKVHEGAQIWEATSRTDAYMYGVMGVYYDAELTKLVSDSDVVKDNMTIYVVCPNYKYVPKVTVTVYVVSEDGEMLTNTVDENVREDQTVWSLVSSYCGYDGYRFVKMAYDAEGKRQVPGDTIVSDKLEVYAIMEKGETQWYPLCIEYMLVSGNNILPVGSHSSDRTMGNMPLISQGVGEERGYPAEGVYYDAQLTIPVGEYDVLNKDTTIYVKLVAPEMSGEYDLYGLIMTEQGPMPGQDIIGKATVTNGIITLHRDLDEESGEYTNVISGEYVDLGGRMQFWGNDLHMAMVLIQGDMAFLYYEFDGSSAEEKEGLEVIAGHYEFAIEGDLVILDLLSTGVFKMSNHGVSYVGPYDFNAVTNEIILHAMGESETLIYDPVNKTVSYPERDDNGPNYEEPSGPSQGDFTGRTFYAPTQDASGNEVQHELGCDELGWFLVLEPSYAESLGLESYSFNAKETCIFDGNELNFFIEEYVVFNITLHPENGTFVIQKFVDLRNNEYNESCAKYAGKYQLHFEGEITTVELHENGVAVVYSQGGKDIAEFYEVEEGVLSIGDRERVIVSGDMLIVEENEYDGGGSSGKLPSIDMSDYN